jgi:hypothetical protein
VHYRAGDVRDGFMRRATPEDAGAIARLHRRVVRKCLPFLPNGFVAWEQHLKIENGDKLVDRP